MDYRNENKYGDYLESSRIEKRGDDTILVIGDIHARSKEVPRAQLLFSRIITAVKTYDPDYVVIMGDTLDRFSTVNTYIFSEVDKFLTDLSEIKPVILLIGNHDYPNNSVFCSDVHAFRAYKTHSKIEVVDYPILSGNIDILDKFQIPCVFTPYVATDRLMEALDKCGDTWKEAALVFGHSELNGCQMGGIISETTDVWDEHKHPYAIMGHCHNYHQLGANVTYVGSPMQHSGGDNRDKTISLLRVWKTDGSSPVKRCEGRNIRSHRGYVIVEDRIDLYIPKYEVYHMSTQQANAWYPECYGYNVVKCVIHGTPAEILAIKKMGVINRLKDSGIRVTTKVTVDRGPMLNPESQAGEFKRESKARYRDILLEKLTNSENNADLITTFKYLFPGGNETAHIQPHTLEEGYYNHGQGQISGGMSQHSTELLRNTTS